MTISPAQNALSSAIFGTGVRKFLLISMPERLSMKDIEGIFAGYNAALGQQSDGVMVICQMDGSQVQEDGKLSLHFNPIQEARR